jgi:hypothetical protein
MGSDARASICFGVQLDPCEEYPWGYDMDKWWLEDVCKYTPPFEIFDKDGDFLGGVRPLEHRITEYYQAIHTFKEAHPIPIDIVSHAGGDDSEEIIAVKGSEIWTSWDSPTEVPSTLTVKDEDIKIFKDFCKKYLNEDVEPKWLLSAYYG